MPLTLHHATRTDLLADDLAGLLATPLHDPFDQEVIVVPARGVERWLTQRLSHRIGTGERGGDGVCAGVRFLTPHSLVSMLLGREHDDPWAPDQVVWPLLRVIDASLGDPLFTTLADHLGHGDPGDDRSARRYAVARRLAGLFHSYALQRPTLLADWRAGRDHDGTEHPIDEDLRWQPELWRRLESEVPAAPPDIRHEQTVERLRSGDTASLDLPARLSLFGHTRLPASEVVLLRALAVRRDVHLWLPQISPSLWEELAPAAEEGPVRRSVDTTARLVHHPLLAALGRDSRELRRTLGDLPTLTSPGETPVANSLLGWLQHDLRSNTAADAETRAARVVRDDDRSVQVHSCHGAARQVDVLREVLVGLLEDDPTLEPRDILVMCPDIESYAPLISAGFGLADVTEGTDSTAAHPGHRLRVRLADRALGATNPLLGIAATLVELSGGRLTATEVLDLAATSPVRLRFGFSDDDLERVTGWVRDAGVRWGHDVAHRGRFGLGLDANTWLTGMRRVLLGAAVSGQGHRHVAGTLPLDDVGDGDLDLLGRFAEFLDRLHTFTDAAFSAHSATDWSTALRDGVAGLTQVARDDVWQTAQFTREMERLAAGQGAHDTVLRHADVRSLLARSLRGRPTRSNFRTGTLTVCTMVPMRSVPHRVVALVGLDDGTFPRVSSVDGDDVLARAPMTGERDLRSEDRQLLLDAIGAATETLVLTYSGRGEHTGSEHPPAVPVGELVDALDVTASRPDDSAVRDHVVVHHPLQPFDEANLVPGRLVGHRPFSFDRTSLAGACAARTPALAVRELVPTPLPPVDEDAGEGVATIALSDLHDFLRHPVKAFCRQRLRVTTPREGDEGKDAVPISLDALEQWDVGDRMIRDVLDGADPQSAMVAEQLRGLLPPGHLGVGVLKQVVGKVRPLVEHALPLREGTQRAVDVDIDLGDVRLTGTVPEIHGNTLVRVSYSSLGAKHRIAGWLDALALAAGAPDENWTVHTIGRHRSGGTTAMVKPVATPDATRWLRDLVEVYRQGLREPLPLPLKASLAWAEKFSHLLRGGNADPDAAATYEWLTPRFNDSGFPKEDADAWHVRAFGPQAPLDALTAPLRADDVAHPAVADDLPTLPHRLGHYAWRVWGPLISDEHELVRGIKI